MNENLNVIFMLNGIMYMNRKMFLCNMNTFLKKHSGEIKKSTYNLTKRLK